MNGTLIQSTEGIVFTAGHRMRFRGLRAILWQGMGRKQCE